MKIGRLSIGVLFLFASTTLVFAQEKKPREKKIKGVTIKGKRSKSDESNIISVQKKSVEVVERVGATQLKKQGVGDVATAVTKATGAQKQEGSGVIFVRGLGDRNNATTMNGLPVPSNDPKYKNIDLGIFKTDIIEYIALEKVYSPRIFGDMNGANVDIISKEHRGKPYFKVGVGSSFNTNNANVNHYYLNDGPNWFGYSDVKKPSDNALLTEGFPFKTSLDNKERYNPFNSSMNIEFGKTFKMGKTSRLSIFGYGGFSNDYNHIEGVIRNYDLQNVASKNLTTEQNIYKTSTVGVVNLHYKLNKNHQFKLITNYIHSSEQRLGYWNGFIVDVAENNTAEIRRGEFKNNDLFIAQLGGENKITDKIKLFWNAGYNRLDSSRPDRTQTSVVQRNDGSYTLTSLTGGSASDNHRYFDDYLQNDFVGDIHAVYKINPKTKVTLGYQGRFTSTEFDATQYNLSINGAYSSIFIDKDNMQNLFNLNNFNAGVFNIRTFRGLIGSTPNALKPATFDAAQISNSAYGNFEYKLSDKLTAQLGLRLDGLLQGIVWNVQVFGEGSIGKEYYKILPAFNLKYAVNRKNNLRLSLSKTYTNPLMLEVAPFTYSDVAESSFGNPNLEPSDNYNVDVKWEFFPKKGEVISLTAYGKYIQNPISKTEILSAANEISFINSGDYGYVFGAEFELRKDLYKINHSRIYTFLNASYLNSTQELDNEKVSKENNNEYGTISTAFNVKKDDFQGASDLIANVNLGYEYKWDKKNSLDIVTTYGYVSDNIYALGTLGRGNQVDKALSTLNANVKLNLKNGLGFSFSGLNLLNPTVKRTQDNGNTTVTLRAYKKGIKLGFGASYKF